jgi:hypothetical protein
MTAHAAIAAVPVAGTPNRSLLQAMLVTRLAYVLGDLEDPEAFDPRGEDGLIQTMVIGYRGQWFWYDEADGTTGHDGTTCIVTAATGSVYKVFGVSLLITSVISNTLITPPDPDDVDEEARPNNGDAYLVPAAAEGPWATWEDSIAVWVEARLEWFRIEPKVGWPISVPGPTRDTVYRYDSVQSAWIKGDGATLADRSVPLSAIIGTAASLTIRVQNQTTYAPPGSRKTGATPSMPLGGTASNINDNNDATTAVTSAIGNKSGASVADRIVARLALASPTDLIALEVRGVLGSSTSSSNAMGLYYSTNNGSSWTQAGSGFTLSASAQNIQRTGSFAGVTDIALVTEAKNWASATNTLSSLNAFDATVTASVGDTYIGASNGIGVFAGMTGKVLVCEVENTFTAYTPAVGDEVYDIGLGIRIRWAVSGWHSTGGGLLGSPYTEESGSGSTSTNQGGTAACYSLSAVVGPSSTTFRHISDDAAVLNVEVPTGSVLRFRYRASGRYATSAGAPTGGQQFNIGLFRDAESTAIAWVFLFSSGSAIGQDVLTAALEHIEVEFPRVIAADGNPHTYAVKIFSGHDAAGNYRYCDFLSFRSLSADLFAA